MTHSLRKDEALLHNTTLKTLILFLPTYQSSSDESTR